MKLIGRLFLAMMIGVFLLTFSVTFSPAEVWAGGPLQQDAVIKSLPRQTAISSGSGSVKITGSFQNWAGNAGISGIIDLGELSGTDCDIRVGWSENSIQAERVFLYAWDYPTVQLAMVPGVSDICDISDAASFGFPKQWCAGPVTRNEFVVFNNPTTGYYAAIRVDSAFQVGDQYRFLNITWYVQDRKTADFSDFCGTVSGIVADSNGGPVRSPEVYIDVYPTESYWPGSVVIDSGNGEQVFSKKVMAGTYQAFIAADGYYQKPWPHPSALWDSRIFTVERGGSFDLGNIDLTVQKYRFKQVAVFPPAIFSDGGFVRVEAIAENNTEDPVDIVVMLNGDSWNNEDDPVAGYAYYNGDLPSRKKVVKGVVKGKPRKVKFLIEVPPEAGDGYYYLRLTGIAGNQSIYAPNVGGSNWINFYKGCCPPDLYSGQSLTADTLAREKFRAWVRGGK